MSDVGILSTEIRGLLKTKKLLHKWTKEEDITVYNCLHSGDAYLEQQALEAVGMGIMQTKRENGGEYVIAPILKLSPRYNAIIDSIKSIDEDAVDEFWIMIQRKIYDYRPDYGGNHISIMNFIKAHCVEQTIDQLSIQTGQLSSLPGVTSSLEKFITRPRKTDTVHYSILRLCLPFRCLDIPSQFI